jgi:hypothetical protein
MDLLFVNDIPPPDSIAKSGKRICFVVNNFKVFKKLKELRWYWLANGESTDWHPQLPVKIFLGRNGRLTFCLDLFYIASDNPVEFELVEIASNSNFSKANLKQLNSSPGSTNCASCGGLLKEPWSNIKHCPKCEP